MKKLVKVRESVGLGFLQEGEEFEEHYSGRYGNGMKLHKPLANERYEGARNVWHIVEYWVEKQLTI